VQKIHLVLAANRRESFFASNVIDPNAVRLYVYPVLDVICDARFDITNSAFEWQNLPRHQRLSTALPLAEKTQILCGHWLALVSAIRA